ncbi:unnamed protein product [Hymenolepis diminuta]|uniref:Homologous-pairing protein 2 homolog n=1 Tax=Hymenolepis diminuta TaxID=6216 RepID=A0A0R3SXV7_HYMDI|nr:unnamed protein product [Hymenolepis diminuta]
MSKNPKADVLAYMTRENRPFSVNDVVTALQKAHGKTALSKAIDELVLEDALVEKVYGKQKVFVVSQVQSGYDKLPSLDDSELKAMDSEIASLSSKVQHLNDKIKLAESELKSVESSLSLEEALKMNADIEIQIAELKRKIGECGSEKPVSVEEFKTVETKQKSAVDEWRRRKRMAMEIVDAIAENYPKSRVQLMEDMGIETDENRGISIADFTST